MIPGSANFAGMNEAQRNAIVQALLAQTQSEAPADGVASGGAFMGDSVASDPNAWPIDPSDPADYSSGFTAQGSALLGDLGGLSPTGFANSVNSQALGEVSTGLQQGHSPDTNAAPTGTGLGLAVTGYNSGYGTQADMAAAQADAITAGIVDAMATSTAINDAVDAMGYNSSPAAPSDFSDPSGFAIEAGLSNPGGLMTSDASMNSDAAPGGFGTGTGFSSADAANSAVAGALADAGEAAGVAGLGGFGGDSDSSGEGGGGGGAGGGSGK